MLIILLGEEFVFPIDNKLDNLLVFKLVKNTN